MAGKWRLSRVILTNQDISILNRALDILSLLNYCVI